MSLWCNILIRLENNDIYLVQTKNPYKYRWLSKESDLETILNENNTKFKYLKKLGNKTIILESDKQNNDLFFYNKINMGLFGNGLIIYDFKYKTFFSCLLNDEMFNYDIMELFDTLFFDMLINGDLDDTEEKNLECFFKKKSNDLSFLNEKGEVFLFSEFYFLKENLNIVFNKKNSILSEIKKLKYSNYLNNPIKISLKNWTVVHDYDPIKVNNYIKDFF